MSTTESIDPITPHPSGAPKPSLIRKSSAGAATVRAGTAAASHSSHAGSDSSGVVALEESLSKKGIGEGKVMMTFGVTGSARHCETAYQLAIDHCVALGGFVDQSGLGENWAHGRFRAPYLVHQSNHQRLNQILSKFHQQY